MVRDLLLRGMLAGLFAGLLVFTYAKLMGEPQVDRAITFETQMDEAKEAAAKAHAMPGVAHEADQADVELVSRHVQSTWGLLTAAIVYSAAMGGLFALTFAFGYGRLGPFGPKGIAALLAAAGFFAIYYVPSLKYPANPPSVGDPATIGIRTGLFFLMIIVCLAALSAAVSVGRRLAARYSVWTSVIAAGVLFVGIVLVAQFLLPDINEVPEGFPAVVLWRFRMASLGMQVILWSSLGLSFGYLAERVLETRYVALKPRAQPA